MSKLRVRLFGRDVVGGPDPEIVELRERIAALEARRMAQPSPEDERVEVILRAIEHNASRICETIKVWSSSG